MFCISLFAASVQPWIFAMLDFAFPKLNYGIRSIFLPLRDCTMPQLRSLLNNGKKKTSGRPRSVSGKSGTLRYPYNMKNQ
ncbi:hypothetical protein V8C42DRAFT_323000 [Trichoderma barbatum]